MNDLPFLQSILSHPEDPTPRGMYIDWLEDQSDPRAEYVLPLSSKARPLSNPEVDEKEHRSGSAESGFDPRWVAFMKTLGSPFRTVRDNEFFRFDQSLLPFDEQIGLRGKLMTFETQFRNGYLLERGLFDDLEFLTSLKLGNCYSGAADFRVLPFMCELKESTGTRTAADVIVALKASNFRSNYIESLDATQIPYPGYQPGDGTCVVNDEIHCDFPHQYIFPHDSEDSSTPIGELEGAHGALKRAVVDGRLWYVLLHTAPGEREGSIFSDYVLLFAVGESLKGNRLIGVLTCQVCHNLCD